MKEIGQFLHDSLQEVVQDLVFEAGTTNFHKLSEKIEDKFGRQPREYLKRIRMFNSSLPKSWLSFLRSIPNIETKSSCRKIQTSIHPQPLCRQRKICEMLSDDLEWQSESRTSSNSGSEYLNDAREAWESAAKLVKGHKTLANYRHYLIVQACNLIFPMADVNASDNRHNTPLHFISSLPSNTDYHSERNEHFLKLLLKSGADPRKKNKKGFTALSLVTGRIYMADSSRELIPNSPEHISSSLWISQSRLEQVKTLLDEYLYVQKEFKLGKTEIESALNLEYSGQTPKAEDVEKQSYMICALLGKLSLNSSSARNYPIEIKIESKVHKVLLRQLCDKCSPPRRVGPYRYDTDMIIGEGAMSKVFLAVDEKGRREAALKRIPKDYKNRALDREIRALCDATHCEQVINYWELIEEDDFYFIGIELMEGDLAHLIRNPSSKQLLTNISKLTGDMVKGLVFLHQKKPAPILHRDLKPGNVLYRTHPQLCLKLADFGLAKDLTGYSSLASTSSHSLVGTRGWMAPELVSRLQKDHTTSSDVFALGLVCYFLMSLGRHPYDSSGVYLAQDGSRTLVPHEVEGNIVKGRQNILSSLSPEQKHFLQAMLQNTSRERPPAEAILHHCYLWSNHKKIQFLKAVGDQKEVAQGAKHSGSSFTHHLSQTDLGRRLIKSSWDLRISKLYNDMTSAWKHKKYDTSSAVDLVRFFRNAYSHEEERSTSSKADLMANIFFQEFPDLCLAVRETILQENWHLENSARDRQTIIRALKLE